VYNRFMAVVYETEEPLAPRAAPGPYRAADYFALPDEPRCELLFGSLFVTPAPKVRHQDAVYRLARLLGDHADRSGGRMVVSPVDVVLGDLTVVQPDVVYVHAARAGIVRDRIEGAPDLVVEILSPATARRDLGEKLRLYAEAGVAEYWIVDPEARTFERLSLAGDAYRVVVTEESESGRLRSVRFPELAVELDPLWDEIDRALTGRLPG
jgi:Uma2 family endonuclease